MFQINSTRLLQFIAIESADSILWTEEKKDCSSLMFSFFVRTAHTHAHTHPHLQRVVVEQNNETKKLSIIDLEDKVHHLHRHVEKNRFHRFLNPRSNLNKEREKSRMSTCRCFLLSLSLALTLHSIFLLFFISNTTFVL